VTGNKPRCVSAPCRCRTDNPRMVANSYICNFKSIVALLTNYRIADKTPTFLVQMYQLTIAMLCPGGEVWRQSCWRVELWRDLVRAACGKSVFAVQCGVRELRVCQQFLFLFYKAYSRLSSSMQVCAVMINVFSGRPSFWWR